MNILKYASLAYAPSEDAGGTVVADDKATETTTPADKTTETAAPDKSGTGGAAGNTDKAPIASGDDKAEPDKGGTKTIATGADTETEDAEKAEKKAAEPDKAAQWQAMREAMAKHYSAGDEKLYKKELKRLERIANPEGLYGSFRELESRFSEGGLIKVPGKNAKPEEVAAYHKAIGVPEKPEEYFKDLKLDNGAVLGDDDKPFWDGFAQAVHSAGAPPAVVQAAANWYYKMQEEQAAAQDEADDAHRREAEKALKDELGPAFKRQTNAVATLFAQAPGGSDIKNDKSLFARLMGGRTADGKVIGNDPDMLRFMISLVSEVNPAATVVEDGNQSGMTLDAEIEKIEKVMRTDRREYNAKYATRYAELLGAREKMRKRA
jgi:hypothetical protein